MFLISIKSRETVIWAVYLIFVRINFSNQRETELFNFVLIMETKIENVFRLFYVLEVAILLSKCKDKNKDWNHFNHTLFQQELEIVAAQKKKKGTYRYILNLASVLRKEECVEHLKYVLVTGRGGIKQPSRA